MAQNQTFRNNYEYLQLLFSTASIFLVLYYPSCQGSRPAKCLGTTDLLTRFCCILPPFFTRDVAKSCGSLFEYLESDRVANVTGLRRYTNSDCEHWFCVLDTYALITNEGFLDLEKFYAHLDLWVTLNPDFTSVMVRAKRMCSQIHRPYLPLKPCEFYNLLICVRNYLKVYCPNIMDTPQCKEQLEFYKECGQYYLDK